MPISFLKRVLCGGAMLVELCLLCTVATAADPPHYLITNDDASANFFPNSLTFYTIEANGQLTLKQQVMIGITGAEGGYFPANRVVALNAGGNQCVFASDAATGEIDGVDVNTLTLLGHANGSSGDTGFSNGVGLALNAQYLYASFTDSSTIGTFQIEPSCGLSFVGDVKVGGLQGGIIDGMAVHGNMLVATYGDGSIESFSLASVTPVSNGDRQNSTGSGSGSSYPTAVDITQDGRFALFGDTSTLTMIEVSDISSGKLTKTVVYQSTTSINSSNIMLSPDETLLYISNTQGDRITTPRMGNVPWPKPPGRLWAIPIATGFCPLPLSRRALSRGVPSGTEESAAVTATYGCRSSWGDSLSHARGHGCRAPAAHSGCVSR
jgi:hypothetical protein